MGEAEPGVNEIFKRTELESMKAQGDVVFPARGDEADGNFVDGAFV